MFFLKRKKEVKTKIGGDIAYYNLDSWWINSFTDEEREVIRTIYSPFTNDDSYGTIDKGSVIHDSESKLSFLGTLATWFKKPEYYSIAKKILDEAEKHIEERDDILDLHFYYLSCIQVFYRNRNEHDNALQLAIRACENQISINKEAKKKFLKEYRADDLPEHTGYKQLAIIYEKQGKIEKALELTKESLKNGWNKEDCKSRIEKLKKKLAKTKKSN